MAYIPEDRQTEGLVMPFSVAENILLGKLDGERYLKHKIILNRKAIEKKCGGSY